MAMPTSAGRATRFACSTVVLTCLGLVGACSATQTAQTTPAEKSDRQISSDPTKEGPAEAVPVQEPTQPNPTPPPRAIGYVALDLGELPSAVLWRDSTLTDAPLLVSAHGAGGTPEWHCDWLTSMIQSAFVVCLRGKRMGRDVEAYYYPEHHTLGALFDAATAQVLRDYGSQIDRARQVYAAYSQGATMGALMMLDRERAIPNLLLVEGGYESWTTQRCARFAELGGRKVYFACGTQTCNEKAVSAVERLRTVGVQAQAAYAPGAGHTPAGQVGVLAQKGLHWLLQSGESSHVQ